MIDLVDVEDGEEAEQEGFEHGRVRGGGGRRRRRGTEREEQGPEIRCELGQRERAGARGVKEQGQRFEEERQ